MNKECFVENVLFARNLYKEEEKFNLKFSELFNKLSYESYIEFISKETDRFLDKIVKKLNLSDDKEDELYYDIIFSELSNEDIKEKLEEFYNTIQ